MTYLVERLAQLELHLAHLREIAPRVDGEESLRRNLSLHNDVLFSLLTVCQLVIDISGELCARRGLRFEDYTEAVRNLATYDEIPDDIVQHLSALPGFRNVLIHEYVALDYARAIEALDRLEPIEQFLQIVRSLAERL